MLVLSRKCQESVVVGGSEGFLKLLKIKVLEIKSGNVRLGFEVDTDVPVHRLEVWERIHANQPPNGVDRGGEITRPDAVVQTQPGATGSSDLG